MQSRQLPVWLNGWGGHVLAVLAGALFPLGLAPLNLWPLSLLSIALFVALLSGCAPKQTALRGWMYGLGQFGVGVSWVHVSVHTFGQTPLAFSITLTFLLVAILALYKLLFAWAFSKLNKSFGLLAAWVATPGLWVISEWLQGWLFTGFPWLFAGYSQLEGVLSSFAPLLGVFGVSWLLVASAAALAAAVLCKHRWWLSVGVAALPFVIAVELNLLQFDERQPPRSINIGMVQPNVPQMMKWDPEYIVRTLKQLAHQTESLWGNDLIFWPEAAVAALPEQVPTFLSQMAQAARDSDSVIVTGIPIYEKDRFYNSLITLGDHDQRYDKQRLVPFGEYVPLESLIRGLNRFLDLPMSSFSLGREGQSPLFAKGVQIVPAICYEIAYPDLIWQQAQMAFDSNYPAVLLTVSNDAWFGKSWGPHQHMQIAQMRALELGVPLIRVTNNGITAVTDHRGGILSQLPQFAQQQTQFELTIVNRQTPYSRFGEWLLWGLLLLNALAVGVSGRRTER